MNYRTRYGDRNHANLALKKMGYTGLTGAHAQAITERIRPQTELPQFNEEEVRHTVRHDMNPMILNDRRLRRQYEQGATGETVADAGRRSHAEFPGAGRRNGYVNPELHRAAVTVHPQDPTVHDFAEYYDFHAVLDRYYASLPVPKKDELSNPVVGVAISNGQMSALEQ